MIRTRDFFLFLLTVVFLVIGIGSAVGNDLRLTDAGGVTPSQPAFSDISTEGLDAKVIRDLPEERAVRLAQMREKIAALGGATLSQGEPDPVVIDESLNEAEEVQEHEVGVWYCDSVGTTVATSIPGAKFKEVEGARLVYQANVATLPAAPVGTSTNIVLPEQSEVVILQLPLRTSPLSVASCIPNEVVGIALDGSYIKNSEFGVYAIFGGETLVGYALDGFPIYGRDDSVVTDRCGGVVRGGVYSYYLSSEREAVLGCYAGMPVSL